MFLWGRPVRMLKRWKIKKIGPSDVDFDDEKWMQLAQDPIP
jgi:hypothetical protein